MWQGIMSLHLAYSNIKRVSIVMRYLFSVERYFFIYLFSQIFRFREHFQAILLLAKQAW